MLETGAERESSIGQNCLLSKSVLGTSKHPYKFGSEALDQHARNTFLDISHPLQYGTFSTDAGNLILKRESILMKLWRIWIQNDARPAGILFLRHYVLDATAKTPCTFKRVSAEADK